MTDQVKSATRTLELLDYFALVRRPKGLKEIGEALGLPQSSATVLLKTLTLLGYLNYDRSRRLYFPTTKISALGAWIPEALFGGTKLREMLRDLSNTTGETVVIAALNDIYIEYLETIPSSHLLRFDVAVGSKRLLHESPLGWLLVAGLAPQAAEQIMTRSLEAGKANTPETLAKILGEVRLVNEQGYVYGEHTPFKGASTLGLLLPDTSGGSKMAVGVGGVIERMRLAWDSHLASMRSILDEGARVLT